LVDEVSLVISLALVGGMSPQTMYVAPDLTSEEGVIPLKLMHIETIKDRYIWVRYKTVKS
jgi:riboflavin biosynthesis pyrimidine reductase